MRVARRSCPQAAGDFSEEDLIRQESVLISVTQNSYVKRTPDRGVSGAAARRARRSGDAHQRRGRGC